MLIGDAGQGMFHLPDATDLAEVARLAVAEVSPIGDDVRIRMRMKN
jgi:hypothetical protein